MWEHVYRLQLERTSGCERSIPPWGVAPPPCVHWQLGTPHTRWTTHKPPTCTFDGPLDTEVAVT